MSPVCDPPRRSSVRSVGGSPCARLCARRRRSAVGGPGRVDPGPPQRLVDEQVAEPGDAVLVHQHGLDRRGALRRAPSSSCANVSVIASGPSRLSSGSSSTAPSRRGSRSMKSPPSAKCTPKRCHFGDAPVARVDAADRRLPRRRRARDRSCRDARRSGRRGRGCRARSACRDAAAAVNAFPTSAWRSAGAVVPRFMNQVSGACTFTISRSSALASSTLRAASTSRISGTR